MARPQIEDGYTRIANELMEALAHIRIPGEARQIIDTIIRKTYGFNKKADMISLSQFCLATGMKKPTCSRAIRTASTMNIIKKDNNGNHFYSINKDFETWKPLSKKITHIIKKDNHTKDNITKEKNNIPQKKKSLRPKDGFSAESIAYKLSQKLFNLILINNPYSRLHACGNGDKETTLQRWATDIDLLIRKDGLHPSLVEEVITFTVNDHFWGPNVQSGSKLRMKWDTLVAQMKKKGVSSSNASKLAEETSKPCDAAGRKLNYV